MMTGYGLFYSVMYSIVLLCKLIVLLCKIFGLVFNLPYAEKDVYLVLLYDWSYILWAFIVAWSGSMEFYE
jgi:hypothetical protein